MSSAIEITPLRSVSMSPPAEPDSASSSTLVNAPCPHFSSSRESLSAVEDVSTVTLLAASTDLSMSAPCAPPIRPAERQASSSTRTRPCAASFRISPWNSVAGMTDDLSRAGVPLSAPYGTR